ncbi:phage protease [Mycobacterium sp. DL592]|uniref:phage protease n=1 Tax=Mycobacterium sp. DL592 TaxID=2675524 RepID=UPI0014218812|nr:phage protease [Mycobacterium sp. DL592]
MAITLTDDQAASLLDMLGLPPDTTDVDTILATVQDLASDEQSEGDMAKPSAVAAAAKRIGFDVIETASLESLRRDATEGRQIKAAAEHAKIESTVDDAVRKGKITAARRKHWVALIGADPGMADVLASVPDETAVPLTAVGYGVDSESGLPADTTEWFR